MEETRGAGLNIVGDVETRRGSYANMAFITSSEGEDIIDFVFADGTDADGRISGVLTTRVVLSRTSLLRLRDAIDVHVDSLNKREG